MDGGVGCDVVWFFFFLLAVVAEASCACGRPAGHLAPDLMVAGGMHPPSNDRTPVPQSCPAMQMRSGDEEATLAPVWRAAIFGRRGVEREGRKKQSEIKEEAEMEIGI